MPEIGVTSIFKSIDILSMPVGLKYFSQKNHFRILVLLWSFPFLAHSKNALFGLRIPNRPFETKKRRIRTCARPAAKGLRIARQSRTSNEEPTPYEYACMQIDSHQSVIKA